MSVADYINKYYGPYMCRTDRHKWEVERYASEELDGLKRCEWCGESRIIPFLTLLHCYRHQLPVRDVDIMDEYNETLSDAHYEAIG